jgi:hypothetical protein
VGSSDPRLEALDDILQLVAQSHVVSDVEEIIQEPLDVRAPASSEANKQ